MEIKRRDICNRIAQCRRTIGATQKDMADRLNIGRPAYAKKETGVAQFSIIEITVLAEFFGKSVDWILTGQNDRTKDNLTEEEQRLLGAFREIQPEQRNALLMAAMDLLLASKVK